MTRRVLGQVACLAFFLPAGARAGFLGSDPLGVLREQARLTGRGDAVGDRFARFGAAVAADGDTMVVGAPGSGSFADAGAAYVFVRAAAAWNLQARLSVTGAQGLGVAAAVSGDTIVVGAAEPRVVYVFVRSSGGWSLQAQLTGSDTTFGDGFGRSVSLSGDTLVVGAPDHDTGFGFQSGTAYVFVRSGSDWTEQQRLVSDSLAGQDFFGTSVSVSGESLLVGAPGDDTGVAVDAGSAYVFSRSGSSWSEDARILLPGGSMSGAFGASVSLDGSTLLVGAPGETSNDGAAYVFVRSGASWSLQQRLASTAATASSSFGAAVALEADTAIIGSPGDSSEEPRAGAAHVFVRTASVWSEQQKLTAAVPELQADFGRSVALSSDLAVAGAPRRDSFSGSAFVFRRSGASWGEEARLGAPGTTRFDAFGSAVALEGDVLIVGAPQDDVPGGRGAGSAYVFVRTRSAWTLEQKLVADDLGDDAHFGAAIALSGDTLAVGAPDREGGSVYVFTRAGGLWSLEQKLVHPVASTTFRFGNAVALDGGSLLVGSPGDDQVGGFAAGAALVFARLGGAWALQQVVREASPTGFAQAGFAVAIQGDRALVGAPGGSGPGRVSVFERTLGTWALAATLSASDGTQSDNFGAALGLSGNTAIVGAPDAQQPSGFITGAGYVFVRGAAGAWSQEQKLDDTGAEVSSDLGAAVAVSGDTALVGPAGDFFSTGALLLFTRQAGVWTLGQRIVATDGSSADGYGFAVALSGQTAAVGAPLADTADAAASGAAYVLVPAVSDLAVTIKGAPSSVAQGDLVTYTIEVANNGPDVAPAVGILDSLDLGLVVESASATLGSCTLLSAGASCDLGLLPAGATATVTVAAAGAIVGMQSSRASIQWGGSDRVRANDSGAVSTEVVFGGLADVAVTVTSVTQVAQVGESVFYQVNVENVGPGNAAGIVLDDPTPPGVVASSVTGACAGFPCRFSRVLAGDQRSMLVRLDVPASYPGPDPIVDTASITTLTDDPAAANDSATAATPFFVPVGDLDFFTLAPCRLLDTRVPHGGGVFPLEAGTITVVVPQFITGCGVPASARALSVNVTVTQPTTTGNLRLYPTGLPLPPVSTVNYGAAQTRGSNALVSLNAQGALSIRVGQPSGTVHVILDVFGYFE